MPWRWRRAVGSAAPLTTSSGAQIRHGGGTMANSQSKISTAIETSREELLDLGLRNPLLNYRPSRARGVEVVDELPTEVFRILVLEGRPMSFVAAPEKPEDDDDKLLVQPRDEDGQGGTADRHVDTRLQ